MPTEISRSYATLLRLGTAQSRCTMHDTRCGEFAHKSAWSRWPLLGPDSTPDHGLRVVRMWARGNQTSSQTCSPAPPSGFHKTSPALQSSTSDDTQTSKRQHTSTKPARNSRFSCHALKRTVLDSLSSFQVRQSLVNMLQMAIPTTPYAVNPSGRSISLDSSMSLRSDTSLLLPEEGIVTAEGLRHCGVALNPK